MVEQVCKPKQGYAGIAAALERAGPGETVRLAPGIYEGAETLWLGAGVTLSGEGALLSHAGTGPAVAAQDVAGAVVEDIAIKVVAETVSLRPTPDAAPYAEGEEGWAKWGIVWFDGIQGGRIARVSIEGAKAAAGVYLTGGSGMDIIDCTITYGERTGLVLSQSLARTVRGNRCHGNAFSGIQLISSRAKEIAGNECWQNQNSGIILLRHPDSPDAPSEAALRDNRCHGNAYSGIELLSSRAEEIAGNECWQNQQAGIALARGFNSLDAPSEAALRDNRCHGNALSGIQLVSSRAEEIAGNECWQNQQAGIALGRGSDSLDAPSEAALRDNRCHGNALSGIALFSSRAEEIAGNECWENQRAGISLQRHSDSPDAPSEAALRDNRCHGNSIVGISIESSLATEIMGNRLWGNFQRGLRIAGTLGASEIATFQKNHFHNEQFAIAILHGTALPSEMLDNVAWGNGETAVWLVPTADGYKSTTPIPFPFLPKPDAKSAMVEALEAAGLPDAEMLARFVDGPGCLHCLEDWWPPDALSTDPLEQDEMGGRYLCRSEDSRLNFRREASGDGAAAIWGELERLATYLSAEKPDGTKIGARLALVTADEASLDGLAYEIDALCRAQAGQAVPSDLPSPVIRAIKGLRYGSISVSAPVILNHAPRSQAAMMGYEGLPPMFDAVLIEGRSRFAAALRVLVRTPKLWATILGVPALLVLSAYAIGAPGSLGTSETPETPAYWSEPIAALNRAFASQIEDIQALDLVLLPGAVLAFLATAAALVQNSLPPPLRWRLPSWMRGKLTVSDSSDSPAWRRWARGRIFERDIGVVVVRDAHEWDAQDMEDLRAVMALRPKGKALLVTLHTSGRSQMDRAVLRPLAERPDMEGPDFQALDGLRLAIGRPPELLDLTKSRDAAANGEHKASGLGALLGVKPDDDDRLASMRGNLRDGKWSISDILPMLVIGSTPDLPMQVSRPRSDRVAEFVPPLERELLPFVQMFEADPHLTLELAPDESLLRRVTEGEALRARAVHAVGRRHGDAESIDLIGQASRRQALTDELDEVFDSIETHQNYVRRLLACGLLGALKTAMEAIRPEREYPNLRLLLRALRAASQLDEELTNAGGIDPVRQSLLDEAAAPLASAMSALRVPDDREARRLASLVACRADRMGLLNAAVAFDDHERMDTLKGVLAERIAAAESLHRKLDHSIASVIIGRHIHHELLEADDELRAMIEVRLARNSSVSTTLGELVWKVPDAKALCDLLDAHVAMGGLRTAVLVQQLAGATDLQVKLRAAQAINTLRMGGASLVAPPPGNQRRVPHGDRDIARLTKLIEDPSIAALLARKKDITPSAEPFLDVDLGYFDPSDVEVQNVIHLVLED